MSSYQTWDQVVLIPTEELVYTDWNCNAMSYDQLAQLQADIAPEGDGPVRFDEPCQVVPVKGEDKKWLVIGGEHRSKVMVSIEQPEVPCVIRWDLADKSRQDLMLWSVRRNNLRGKIDAQKYAELESELIDDHGMAAEAARQMMLIDGDLAKALTANMAEEPSSTDSDYESKAEFDESSRKEGAESVRAQAELLNALKVVEQDVLLDSADTVEHGYLFFVQGKKGQTHLVVDESEELHYQVGKMVSACKENKEKVDEFLAAAIEREMKNWE